jgi:uracil phosphoribosyltransferase
MPRLYLIMQTHILSKELSGVHAIMQALRDVRTQKNRYLFRKNVERLGFILAYEMSKTLEYKDTKTTTPLGIAHTKELRNQPIIATILRAGIPLQLGASQLFVDADLAYISAYRKYISETHFDVVVEYLATPDVDGRILILTDPMLATGKSLVSTYKEFLKKGTPRSIHILSVLGSKSGVQHVQQEMPEATLWIADVDEKLDEHGYIIPGLGDAGDLSFGEKV